MKTLKKALALVLAMSVTAMSGSALAAIQGTCNMTGGSSTYSTNYDVSANSLTVTADAARAGEEMTFLILDKTVTSETTDVDADDILFVDQKTASDEDGGRTFTGKINLSRVAGATTDMPAGNYPVRIGFYNSGGFAMGTGLLQISEAVQPAITSITTNAAENATAGAALTITATVDAVGGASTAYTWSEVSKPAGATVTISGNSFTADKIGTYVVKATSSFDSTKTATKTITVVDSSPTLTQAIIAGDESAYTDQTVTLQGSYTNSEKPNVTLTWSVTGPATLSAATGATTVVTPTGTGSATVTLTATAATGATASTTKTIAFSTRPAVTGITTDATASTPAGTALTITANVTAVGDASTAYTWSEVSKPTGATVAISGNSFTADKIGTYVVKATSTFDSSKTATKTITVTDSSPYLTEAIIAGNESAYTDETVTLTGSYVNKDKTDVTLTWSVSGGATLSTTTGATTVVTPTGTGSATVTLTATAATGATASTTKTIAFSTRPAVTGITTGEDATTPAGTALTITATVTVVGDASTAYTWSLTSGPSGAVVDLVGNSFTADKIGTYVVTATANDDSSKTASKTITVTDSSPYLTSASIIGEDSAYTDETVTLTGSYEDGDKDDVTLTWSVTGPATLSAATGTTTVVTPTGEGEVTVTLTATAATGATASTTKTISFNEAHAGGPAVKTITIVWGDLDGNGAVAALDVSAVLLGSVGIYKDCTLADTLNSLDVTVGDDVTITDGEKNESVVWGDLDGNGAVAALDVSAVLLGSVGIYKDCKLGAISITVGDECEVIVPAE